MPAENAGLELALTRKKVLHVPVSETEPATDRVSEGEILFGA
jgi:hypothetical protein